MHLRVSALAISRNTQLHYSAILQTGRGSASVLMPTPLAMTCELGRIIAINLYIYMIFGNFQNASPCNCSDHFSKDSTQLNYPAILKTGAISASALFLHHFP